MAKVTMLFLGAIPWVVGACGGDASNELMPGSNDEVVAGASPCPTGREWQGNLMEIFESDAWAQAGTARFVYARRESGAAVVTKASTGSGVFGPAGTIVDSRLVLTVRGTGALAGNFQRVHPDDWAFCPAEQLGGRFVRAPRLTLNAKLRLALPPASGAPAAAEVLDQYCQPGTFRADQSTCELRAAREIEVTWFVAKPRGAK